MKVLHLFSNARWTGPAEPALNLCVALRRLGVDADFACPPEAPAGTHTMLETARDRGIEPILRFRLTKHARLLANAADRAALSRYLRERPYDLVHCHLDNDHRIALGPAARRGVPIIRSSYSGTGFRRRPRYARMLAGTAWLIEPSDAAAAHDADSFAFARERMTVIPGAVDVERFDPAREVPDARRWLGIPPDAFVVGIVARMQTHRHYEDFFRAIRTLADRRGEIHAIVVGRGTNQERVGKQPVRELGLADRVHFPGYVAGENYVGMVKAFDAKVFLVPGSDGTCRAVREAMAMAKPAVVARRGMLPEIVDDGATGFVVDGGPESLVEAIERLAADRALARSMGHAARAKAVESFSLAAQARAVRAVYESVLAAHPDPAAAS
ncbi:MAG: glycosyltransferase family 4 protein [Candidatus Hydrogenedentes bacterium]|nr:glycosyltransferase family 4 protein [Candidatus Hydrogenedentota bacterium]